MKRLPVKLILLACLVPCLKAVAFSPYENFLTSHQPRQVGLIAALQPGNEKAFAKALAGLANPRQVEALRRAGIRNVSAFTRKIGEKDWMVVHFILAGDRDYLDAAPLFEQATPATRELSGMVEAHPRAERFGSRWLQMEWINYIRGRDVDGPAMSNLMIVTTVIPEKEREYRSLHQAVWPGVVDQVVRSNNRDLCIFLAGIDDLLVEFLYLEYVGNKPEADEAMSQSDAINHRWWKLTDACQKGLPGVEGNWVLMDPVK